MKSWQTPLNVISNHVNAVFGAHQPISVTNIQLGSTPPQQHSIGVERTAHQALHQVYAASLDCIMPASQRLPAMKSIVRLLHQWRSAALLHHARQRRQPCSGGERADASALHARQHCRRARHHADAAPRAPLHRAARLPCNSRRHLTLHITMRRLECPAAVAAQCCRH